MKVSTRRFVAGVFLVGLGILSGVARAQIAPGVGTASASFAKWKKAAGLSGKITGLPRIKKGSTGKCSNKSTGNSSNKPTGKIPIKGTDVSYTADAMQFAVTVDKKGINDTVEQNVTLTNEGATNYTVTAVINPSEDFSATPSSCQLPAEANSVLGSCTIKIVYNHESADEKESKALLNISLADASTPTAVFPLPPILLSGKKTASPAVPTAVKNLPGLTVTPVKFFTSVVNDSSAPQKIVIHNGTGNRYTLKNIAMVGETPTAYTLTSCETPDLDAKNRDCEMQIVYSPTKAEADHAQLHADVYAYTNGTIEATPAGQILMDVDGKAFGTCVTTPGYKVVAEAKLFFPLDRHGVDETAINCFYNTPSNTSFATQVQYLYNPAGSANTASVDIASFQFMGGFQLTLAGTAQTSSCSTPATATSSSTGQSCSGSATTNPSTPSQTQVIDSLEQGGDFALKVYWPFYVLQPVLDNKLQAYSFINPRAGFTVNGLSAAANSVNATDVNFNLSSENYVQYDALPATRKSATPGSIFADYRLGLEHLSPDLVQTAGLSQSSFLLQQLTVGIIVNNSFRISAERYFGPMQAYALATGQTAPTNAFSAWHLRVQITPTSSQSNGASQ